MARWARPRSIRALHGEDVIEGKEAMTQGVAATDSRYKIDEQAGVFTRVEHIEDDDLTVHFWDFGGQVMAHATHQFFLRSKCLYVIVLAGRAERNPNEEAEYWLEHVRAFGDSAPVLLVGNKADVMPVNLDLRTLMEKYPNIAGFYSIFLHRGERQPERRIRFSARSFGRSSRLSASGGPLSEAEFKVLKAIENRADKDDLLPRRASTRFAPRTASRWRGQAGATAARHFRQARHCHALSRICAFSPISC